MVGSGKEEGVVVHPEALWGLLSAENRGIRWRVYMRLEGSGWALLGRKRESGAVRRHSCFADLVTGLEPRLCVCW